MNILDKLRDDLKKAILNKNELEKRVLRMLISAVKNFEVSTGKPITEEEFDMLVKKQVKEREEAMEDYKKGGRQDLFEDEKAERDILKKFARPELSDEEIKKVVEDIANTIHASSKKEFGKLMGAVMKVLKGKASGERIKKIVEGVLNAKEEQNKNS